MQAGDAAELLSGARRGGDPDHRDCCKGCGTKERCRRAGSLPPVASDGIGDDEGDAAPEIKDGKAGAAQI